MTQCSFVHPHMWTLQTITGKVKSNHASISHAIIDRKLNPRLPQAYMTSDRNDGFIPTRPQARDNLSFTQRGIGKCSGSRTVSVIKDSFRVSTVTNICDNDRTTRIEDSIIISSRKTQRLQTSCQQNASIANIKASVNAMRQTQTI